MRQRLKPCWRRRLHRWRNPDSCSDTCSPTLDTPRGHWYKHKQRYQQIRCRHTHIHARLTAIFPGLPGWACRYQKGKIDLDFTAARDSEWQWHQQGHMQVCTSLQTDNNASNPPLGFLQAGCPSCCQTKSIKALKATTQIQMFSIIRGFVDTDCNSLFRVTDTDSVHIRGHNLRLYKEHCNVNRRMNAFVCRNMALYKFCIVLYCIVLSGTGYQLTPWTVTVWQYLSEDWHV